MSSTPATISDEFVNDQSNDTLLAIGVWTPEGSGRGTSGTTVSGGNLNILQQNSAQIAYVSPDFDIITYDISRLATVSVMGITSAGNVTLQVYDNNTELSSANVTIINGNAVFDIQNLSGTADLENIREIYFIFFLSSASATAERISFTFVCVAKNSMILMSDATEKPIQDIKRGDLIMGEGTKINKVARLLHTQMQASTILNIVKIPKDTISENVPNRELIIAGKHPILDGKVRRPARCYRKLPNVQFWNNCITADKVLPVNDDGKTYSLYNIQYEHDGFFVANGVVVDSVPVKSIHFALPKELYFNEELFDKPLNVKIPKLNKTLIDPIAQ